MPWDRADGLGLVIGAALYGWCGPLYVLDVEAPHRPEAEGWLDRAVPSWRDGMVVESGSGGLHVYGRAAEPAATTRLPWGDLKGDRSLVYLPPTRSRKTGRLYQWLSEGEPVRLEPSRLPGVEGQRSPVRSVIEAGRITATSPGRNQTLFRLGCLLRRNGFDAATIRAVLHAVNAERCAPPLDTAEVDAIATSVARYEPTARRAWHGTERVRFGQAVR
jgi:hypothetical protein